MICPECKASSHVYRTINLDVTVQRFRECLDCGLRWDTWENSGNVRIAKSERKAKPEAQNPEQQVELFGAAHD